MKTLLEQINDFKAEVASKQNAIDELTKLVEQLKNAPQVSIAETAEYKALLADNDAKVATISDLTMQLESAKLQVEDFDKKVQESAGKLALSIAAQQGLPTPVKDIPEKETDMSKIGSVRIKRL